MPSSPFTMQNIPIPMHHDAQKWHIGTNASDTDDGSIHSCGCTFFHRSHRKTASLELHLPGMDIWGCELQVQIFGQR